MMPLQKTKKVLLEIRSQIDKKQYDQAIRMSQDVLKQDSTNYHAHVFVGVAASAQHDYETAIKSYQTAIGLRPELSLAYKGLIQTLTKSDSPSNPLVLARAYYGVGIHSPEQAPDALPRAADTFFTLAVNDVQLREEAVAVLRAIREVSPNFSESSYDDILVYRLCKLLSLSIPSANDSEELAKAREKALTTLPLSNALDDLVTVLTRINYRMFYDGTAELAVERACQRCMRNDNFIENLAFLRHVQAHDALLQVAETDMGRYISRSERELLSLRSIHMRPFRPGKTRAKSILATRVFSETGDSEVAIHLAGAAKVSAIIGAPKGPVFCSCTHAFVAGYLHLIREEFKNSIEASNYGQRMASPADSYTCIRALFSLLLGAALRGDRKYNESLKSYESVRLFGISTNDVWLTSAANRGLVDTAVIAYGRGSRHALMAMENAASSSQSTFGVLECIWSDALSGDIDLSRMEELANRVEQVARAPPEKGESSTWEYALLNSQFTISAAQLSALALMRLGQMILKAKGFTLGALTTAQRHYMSAATYGKEMSGPFAHLGFILEQLATHREKDKMCARAIRCYERALAMEATNPLASRRLARMLCERGFMSEAANIARKTSDRNPKARWAFNLLGWWRLSCERYSEAVVAFHAALRGRPKRTSKEEDMLFGTNVGTTLIDNDLLVDIDSWRGLSMAYRIQGKFRSACACLDDALRLINKPPFYSVDLNFNYTSMLSMCQALIESEKSILEIIMRKSTQTRHISKSILENDTGPLTVGYYLAEALMVSAAEEWINGCYQRASTMRERAGGLLESWISWQIHHQPLVNCSVVLKRLGDIWMEVAGEFTNEMAEFFSKEYVDKAISNALIAYSKASHFAPWQLNIRVQDISAALQRRALFLKDEGLARKALDLLLIHQADSSLVALSFLAFSSISSQPMQHTSKSIAARVLKSVHSGRNAALLGGSVALQAVANGDISFYAEAAVISIRADPTDWRGWYAVGKVREIDAERHGWPADKVKSCDEAYGEADRLGGGPPAVMGRLRCVTNGLHVQIRSMDHGHLYSDACFGLSMAGRVGFLEPPICREIVDTFNSKREDDIVDQCKDWSSMSDDTIHSRVHLFPFIPAVRKLISTPGNAITAC